VIPVELSLSCLSSSVVVLSIVKLIVIFAKFKMAANATIVKELNVLKQCCNPLNVSHSTSFMKNPRPVFDWVIKEVPSIQKGQRIHAIEKLTHLCKSFENEAVASSSSEYGTNKK
jgi:BarA-like signal transduction histidine kinase